MATPDGLYVQDDRSGGDLPTVVVVHGAMDRTSSFGRMARHLPDVALVRYDRRGYGRSSALGPVGLDGQVDDLLEVIDGRRVTVFGHSVGGVIALVAASRHTERIASVLVYEPPTPWAPWWPKGEPKGEAAVDPAEEAEAFMRRAIGDRFWNRLPARAREDRRAEGPALLADIASVSVPLPFEPEAVTAPVIVAYGDETTPRHARAARELASALPAGELTVIAGAGHGAHLSHPTAMAHLVQRAVAAGR